MDFGLFFFSNHQWQANKDPYHLLLESARFADKHHFSSIWTPERHFDAFGSIFPNPAILSSALAMITNKIQLRSGSLISPLHDTVRIAEEWAVVDNLSHGRIAISFGAGWNINDFIFFPERYHNRKAIMFEQISEICTLWQGKPIQRRNSAGTDISVFLHPRPVQPTLPIWITSSGSTETFEQAGKIGANILTHLMGQDLPTLAHKIQCYHAALRANQFNPADHTVTLMVHTFLGTDPDAVYAQVKTPFREYLRSAVLLENQAALGGGTISGGFQLPSTELDADLVEELLDISVERYYQQASLIGTLETCYAMVQKFAAIGVNEIACLIDFGVAEEAVLQSLHLLNELRALCQVL